MDILANLRRLIGEDLVLDPESLGTRAAGIGRPDKMVAAAMARPKTTEQVSAILRWCNSNGVKVIPYGRLRERPAESSVAFVASDSFAGMVGMLRHMDRVLGGTLSAFEVMWNSFYRLVTPPPAIGRPPLSQDYPFYMLIEALGAGTDQFNSALESALGLGLISDAVIAQSQAECTGLLSLRDDMSQLNRHGVHITFDISLPAADMERYTQEVARELPDLIGDHQLYIFGHLGDGNLHVVVGVAPSVYPEATARVEQLVYGKLKAIGGSVSAEHGIGLEKKSWLPISRSEAEIALMRAIKQALDPRATLNPGKVL